MLQLTSRKCYIMFLVYRRPLLTLEFQVLLNVRVHVSGTKIQAHHHETKPATSLKVKYCKDKGLEFDTGLK